MDKRAIHFAGTEAREHFKPDAKYGFEELLDVYHFWSRNAGAVQSRYLRRFNSFSEIKEMTENPDAQEAELKRMVALVERLENRLPSTLKRLSASAVGLKERKSHSPALIAPKDWSGTACRWRRIS